jgi:hypothetical protein
MRRIGLLLALVLLPRGVQAQTINGGYAAVGRAAADHPSFHSRLNLAAGYELSMIDGGVLLGGRTASSYASFRPNRRAVLDSAGLTDGTLTGRTATSIDEGVDLLAGMAGKHVRTYGFLGLHYVRDSWKEGDLSSAGGDLHLRSRRRTDLARAYGFGAVLSAGAGQGVFAEWFRGPGDAPRMIGSRGVRFGVHWDFGGGFLEPNRRSR